MSFYLKFILILFFFMVCLSSSILAECRLCPEITPVKILLKNGVIRKGHIALNPEEELTIKTDRALEVFRKLEILRLYLSLDSLNLAEINDKMPHILHGKVYMDILYKDIAKIELIVKKED